MDLMAYTICAHLRRMQDGRGDGYSACGGGKPQVNPRKAQIELRLAGGQICRAGETSVLLQYDTK